MHDLQGIINDTFAQKKNWISSIDARVKVVFVLLALLINLLSPTVYPALACTVTCLFILSLIGVQYKVLLFRLIAPLGMAGILIIIQTFFFGHSPLFTIPLGNFQLIGYQEGLFRGLIIMSRIIAGVSLILFLSMSTPVDRLLAAARWFRLSATFVELTLLVYRYIFVLLEEAVNIRNAQKVRFGYHGWHQSMKSLGTLGGSVIIRAYDRAERVFEAMLLRGYTGENRISCFGKLEQSDYLAIAVFVSVLASLSTMGAVLR